MEIQLLAHVPFLRLADDEPRQVGDTLLVPFPMELWRVDNDIRKLDTKIERTHPAALVAPARVAPPPPTHDELVDLVQLLVNRCIGPSYRAILSATEGLLPAPDMSVWYLVAEGGGSKIHEGAFGYEALAFGAQTPWTFFDEPAAGRASDAVTVLGTFEEGPLTIPDIQRGYDVLSECALPDVSAKSCAVQLVTGLEVVVRPSRKGIKQSFADRVGHLLEPTAPEATREAAKRLYAIRSDLVHGRDVDDEDVAWAVHTSRRWLGLALLLVASLVREHDASPESIWRVRDTIARAPEDDAARETLAEHRGRFAS